MSTQCRKILDFYKRNWNPDHPYDVEVYITGSEEKIGNLVDTAQQYMEERIIPVHIVNEDKLSAQYLLAKHPLFFPVLDYPVREKDKRLQTLHFVILGTDGCAEYLLREAFWMMSFTKTHIFPKITLIGKNASKVLNHIYSQCPGLRKGISEDYKCLESYESDISPEDTEDFYSYEFDQKLKKLLSLNEALYFAVSADTDEENLRLAIFLREKLVQYYVKNGMEWNIKNQPPVAFRCKDFNIAGMSTKMVVSMINHGDSWYNSHEIIPFGTYSDIYGWNGLADNVIEHLARCIHLEYNNHCIPDRPECIDNSYYQELKKELSDYYRRQYNKKSSFAVALSIPYRLFNCIVNGHRILPETWNITNPDAYYNYDALAFLADRLRGLTEESAEKTAVWEHDRWVRWMLAEGWLPADADDVHFYKKVGSDKHQLYIGKLHPCIRDWEDLRKLELALKDPETGRTPDFHSFDLNSAIKTEQILRGAIALHVYEISEPQKEQKLDEISL